MKVQLLHMSDVHFAVSGVNAALFRPAKPSRFSSLVQGMFAQGVSGHESRALHAMRRSMRKHLISSTASKTFLACTGDLSAWGDDASVRSALDHLDSLARDLAVGAPLVIYGNHDVWPGTPGQIPLQQSQQLLDQRRTTVRNTFFPAHVWLTEHTQTPVSGSGSPVFGICSLNTVQHCRHRNTLARGRIQRDFYWDPNTTLPDQLNELTNWLADVDVALILTHHPAHDPGLWLNGRLSVSNKLENAAALRSALATPSRHSPKPVRVLLSGHTHECFPPPAALSRATPGGFNANTAQLTIGTCAQSPARNATPKHSWEAIQVEIDAAARTATLKRRLFTRVNLGPFRDHAPESLLFQF